MSIRLFALCSALLMTAAPAGAQQFNDWMTPRPGYTVGSGDESAQYGDARRIAYDNGYRKGVERGENAVRDRRALDLEREKDYRNADNGYNRSFGDKNLYRNMFRNGFADGYRTAYNRYGSNGGYSSGPYLRRKCRAAARHRLGLSPLSWGESGIRQRVGVRLELRVPEWRERRLPEGARRRARRQVSRLCPAEMVSLGRPPLRRSVWFEAGLRGSVPEADSAKGTSARIASWVGTEAPTTGTLPPGRQPE